MALIIHEKQDLTYSPSVGIEPEGFQGQPGCFLKVYSDLGGNAEADSFDPMSEKPGQCFVGSNSAQKSLELILKGHFPVFHALKESDRTSLFCE